MKIETDLLKTLSNFAKEKGIARQRAYKLVDAGKIDCFEIDGVKFVLLNDKAIKYKKN
jgi:hypothetical protein